MCPDEILPGIDLYLIFLCLGVMSAIITYRVLSDKMQIEAKLQNLCIFTAVAAIIGGYFFAVFFQALYNIPTLGKFVIDKNTGATFYGGLIGGTAIFLLVYFIAGSRIFPDKLHIKRFFDNADIAACCITIAHSLGRIGCLMAGCCYGKPTDAWFGITMKNLGYKVIPTQLFESIFLFFLFVYLVMRIKDKQTYGLQIYLCMYGVWRFVIEYLRDDYRGSTVIKFLTPSQLTAILMVLAGVILVFVEKKLKYSFAVKEKSGVSETAEDKKSDEYEYEDYDYDYGENKQEESQTKDENNGTEK